MRGAVIADLLAQVRRKAGAAISRAKQAGGEPLHLRAAITLISTFAPRSSLATWTKARAG